MKSGAAADSAGSGGAAAPPRVLVIDDEPTIRAALRRYFGRRGWAYDDAESGAEALTMLLDDCGARYALVISDLRMPQLSGSQLFERLATACPELLRRLVFTTGDTASQEAADFLERSGCVVLEKPFSLQRLDELIRGIRSPT